MSPDLIYQIALTTIPNIGPVQAKILVNAFGNAEGVFKAKKDTLEVIDGIGEVKANSIKQYNNFASIEDELKFVETHKIQPIFITDPSYPQRLLKCYDSPTLLYYRGTANLNATKIISIIGTRNNTEYGKQVTEQLVTELKPHDVLIISGLAYGIDSIAHKSAVQNNITNIGVLAHGLDKIYPAQHTSLAKQLLLNGGLLTEFRKGTLPDRHNFPKRNRIVAGMADCTIVVETANRGGSMITAELARGYNRDVFAFPGRINDSKSAGCNYLIKTNKAVMLTDTTQLVQALGWQQKKIAKQPQRQLFIDLSPEETVLMQLLQERETVHIDEIFLKSGLTSSTVAAAMLNLEFQNIVTSLPGKMYKLV
ncbi:MAG: dprA [Segetibacter sp.]|nr:dprA [Segetibacter sp.]